uniref:Uncharacterized protein n=1 Tax=Cyanothece sp. (strain PCC 7425 / ATCC 29141) TaxID=395961 RepID=B8HWJ8_CYAP4
MLYRSDQGTYLVARALQEQPQWSEFTTITAAWSWLKSEGYQPKLLY